MLPAFEDAGFAETARLYLDTPSSGLPPLAAVLALSRSAEEWRTGERYAVWEDRAQACRNEFARQRQLRPEWVGLVPSVTTPFAALAQAVAEARLDGRIVVAHRREFRSLLLPFLAALGPDALRLVDGPYTAATLAGGLGGEVALVLVSSIGSADGARPDLGALAGEASRAGAALAVDSTQSEGIVSLGLPYERCALVAAAAYKGLMSPRGTGYAVAVPGTPLASPAPSPYGMADTPRQGSYGPPLNPYPGGHGLDQSLSWLGWDAARSSLELLAEARGLEGYVLGLAQRLEDGLRSLGAIPQLSDVPSPVQSIAVREGTPMLGALERAGIRAAVRGGRLRMGVHGYTSPSTVDTLLTVLDEHTDLIAKDDDE